MATSLADVLREELRKEGVKLWLPPFSPSVAPGVAAGNEFPALAEKYAKRLAKDLGQVTGALEDLRQHALLKLREKTRVTVLGKVLGGGPLAAGRQELRVELCSGMTGGEALTTLSAHLSDLAGATQQLRAIASGRVLAAGAETLEQQGWLSDLSRQGQPLRVLLVRSGPVKSTSSEGFGDFELFDAATGKLVPVPPAARQALITAIALHARGRELLSERGCGGVGGGGAEGGGEAAAATAALEFLAEADRCFERCEAAGAGALLGQIDNFGQLQLDICWAYALLGDTDHLPDAEKRLQVAERMINRQVTPFFMSVAEGKAKQGSTVDPQVLPSVKLWLLRGIARRCRGDAAGARADLQKADLFIRALQVDVTALEGLLVLGASRVQAVAALRRCGGDVEQAAAALLAAAPRRELARMERTAQRKFGTTLDGSYVDSALVSQLTGMGFDEKAAVKALKRSNNDVGVALDLVQKSADSNAPVDELALCSLISLGFDQGRAERALREAGPGGFEQAHAKLTAEPALVEGARMCDKGHELIAYTRPADKSGSNICDECGREEILPPEEIRRCAVCDFDLCLQCYELRGTGSSKRPADQPAPEDGKTRRKIDKDADAAAAAARETAEAQERAREEAREVVWRELGRCLRRGDIEDEVAGVELHEEDALLQQHLSSL
mmetsp:Transcript_26527/g.87966  ORF Transcript_26527/g.87966 Transcript_26527/m.87966 type:complete len:672 (-) Transcript_26527:110-2125(-)